MSIGRPTILHIDAQALAHNIQCVKRCAPHSKIMAVVKADAYGHGSKIVAQTLQDYSDAFAVCCINEAIQLRDAGITLPIILLEGFFNPGELALLNHYNFTSVIHHQYQLDILSKAHLEKPLPVWLKINTGMNRLGFLQADVKSAYQQLQNCTWVQKPVGLLSHFPVADDRDKKATASQIQLFQQLSQPFSGEHSLANSAAVLAWPQSHADWVRPGIMLYGVSPFEQDNASQYDLQPVMTLSSQLIAIRHCKKGDPVGYGDYWVCPEAMNIGVVAIGYADGYPRHAKNGTPVLMNGKMAKLVGRVSMDLLTVDLRQHPDAGIGDPVTLWGKGLPVEEIARYADTIPYELLCHVGECLR